MEALLILLKFLFGSIVYFWIAFVFRKVKNKFSLKIWKEENLTPLIIHISTAFLIGLLFVLSPEAIELLGLGKSNFVSHATPSLSGIFVALVLHKFYKQKSNQLSVESK